MKTYGLSFITWICLFISAPAFAGQSYSFVFRYPQDEKPTASAQKFEYSTQAESYELAFKKAAQVCFEHFKEGRRLSENEGLSIIDSCANPRGS